MPRELLDKPASTSIKIDGETENLDRESGEGFLTPEDFEKLIYEDSIAEKTIFLVGEVGGKL